MTPDEALQVLFQASEMALLNGPDRRKVQEAVQVLSVIIHPAPVGAPPPGPEAPPPGPPPTDGDGSVAEPTPLATRRAAKKAAATKRPARSRSK
jgi:hypothetical protein